MITRESAIRQILRFADLSFYPKNPDELVLAFTTAFEKDHEAEEFTREWIQFNDEAPKPSNVYERGRQLARTRAKQWDARKPDLYDCPICMDMGWIQSQQEAFVGSATRCQCLLAKIEKQKLEGTIK